MFFLASGLVEINCDITLAIQVSLLVYVVKLCSGLINTDF